MPLTCDVVVDGTLSFDRTTELADLLHAAGQSEPLALSGTWQMTLRLTDDAGISDLHERFFADPSPTDVISFPSGEPPDAAGAHLGDVVVSVETAAEQAVDAGHPTAREVAFLALHGLLHLCGYDDQTPESREAMHARQQELLEAWEGQRERTW